MTIALAKCIQQWANRQPLWVVRFLWFFGRWLCQWVSLAVSIVGVLSFGFIILDWDFRLGIIHLAFAYWDREKIQKEKDA